MWARRNGDGWCLRLFTSIVEHVIPAIEVCREHTSGTEINRKARMMELQTPIQDASAVRGHAITFRADPFFSDNALVDVEDALIVSHGGIIRAFGPYDEVKQEIPPGVEVTHFHDKLICAGFVDTHVHYVQTGIIGAFGSQLIDWLNRYTFVEEQRFAEKGYAEVVARAFFDQLLSNGTTTALTFCAVYPQSVDAFFEESMRRGTRMIGGKVLMDRNAPPGLLDTTQSGYDDSKALISRWHEQGEICTPSLRVLRRPAPPRSSRWLAACGRNSRARLFTLMCRRI